MDCHPGGHSEPADGQDVGGGTGDDQQVEDLAVAKDRQPHRGGCMKKVTSWAAIIAVPTGVTGFYGMNVPYPGFAQHRCMASSQLFLIHISEPTRLLGISCAD